MVLESVDSSVRINVFIRNIFEAIKCIRIGALAK